MNMAVAVMVSQGNIALSWRTLLLTAVAVLAWLAFGAAPEGWVFDRTAIGQGEWWRLLSAHWVHSDSAHATWDIAALLLLGLLFEPRLQWRLPVALLAGTVVVDAWLWWGEPGLAFYCGLSGILNTVLVLGLLQWWRDERNPLLLLVGGISALKIVFEISAGQALLTSTAWPSVPTTHAVGFLCGLLVASVTLRKREGN